MRKKTCLPSSRNAAQIKWALWSLQVFPGLHIPKDNQALLIIRLALTLRGRWEVELSILAARLDLPRSSQAVIHWSSVHCSCAHPMGAGNPAGTMAISYRGKIRVSVMFLLTLKGFVHTSPHLNFTTIQWFVGKTLSSLCRKGTNSGSEWLLELHKCEFVIACKWHSWVLGTFISPVTVFMRFQVH